MHRPLEGLTDAELSWLLQESPTAEVDFGADLLDIDLALVEDISDDVEGGTVSWALNDSIHRTCRLRLTRELEWGNQLVRPWMSLTAGGVTGTWRLGTHLLTTPTRRAGEDPVTWDCDGFDRLVLLQREVGEAYTVTAGTTYRQALLDAFAAAGLSGVLIDGSAADDVLPVDKPWPLVASDAADPDQTDSPVTWLRIVNDLLQAINFRGVWCDESGVFRCAAYQPPAQRGPEWTFDADDGRTTIVGEDRELVEDQWAAPNRWVFLWSNRPGGESDVEGDGKYTVDESDTVNGDRLGRTLVWPKVVRYEAASQAKLVDLGDRRVALDKAVTSTVELTTGPWPGAGHADVYQLVDAEIGGSKVQAVAWSMDLAGGDVKWTLEAVA